MYLQKRPLQLFFVINILLFLFSSLLSSVLTFKVEFENEIIRRQEMAYVNYQLQFLNNSKTSELKDEDCSGNGSLKKENY